MALDGDDDEELYPERPSMPAIRMPLPPEPAEVGSDEPGRVACLEYKGEDDKPMRIVLERMPFVIGRSSAASFVIHSTKVSKEHAEIVRRRSAYVVRDLGSRNGTFVNGERLTEARRLAPGDVIHVAHKTFSFQVSTRGAEGSSEDATVMGTALGHDDIATVRDLLRVLGERLVTAAFQPIVSLDGGRLMGFESLGRMSLDGSTLGIWDMLRVADEHGRSVELSRLLREVAIDEAAVLRGTADPVRLFLNVHPSEMKDDFLVDALAWVPEHLGPGFVPVVEVHEGTITDLRAIARLRAELSERGLELAYDDFGAGQSRLMELAEVPPDFIKFDMSLIRGIDGSPGRQELVRALSKVMRDLGIRVLAEGIETEDERAMCLELGCELGQGYLLSRPAPARTFVR